MSKKPNISDLITQTEAAQIRGVSLSAIVQLVKRGRLTAIDVAGHTHVLRSEVLSFEKLKQPGRPKKNQAKDSSTPRKKLVKRS